MIEFDWQPNDRKLRQFAGCALVLVPMVAWWWQASGAVMAGVMAVSVMVVMMAWWLPGWVRPLYVGVSLIALPIGWVVGEVLLGLIYFGVFWPVGLVFRMLGRDALSRRWDSDRETYWEECMGEVDAKRYYRRY